MDNFMTLLACFLLVGVCLCSGYMMSESAVMRKRKVFLLGSLLLPSCVGAIVAFLWVSGLAYDTGIMWVFATVFTAAFFLPIAVLLGMSKLIERIGG